jgi:HSP20 family protein
MQEHEGDGTMAKKEKGGNGSNVAVHRGEQTLMPRMMQHPWRTLRGEMDSLFDRFFGRWPTTMESAWDTDRFSDVDVEETDNEIIVRAEAPGFEPKEIDIQVSGNLLSIQAEHKEEQEHQEKGFHRWERRYGQMQRSVPLSTAVDADKVDAHYHNGILEVHLPRTEPMQRKRIEVKT